nr:COR domain-containing protein [Massilia sp. JS1662]
MSNETTYHEADRLFEKASFALSNGETEEAINLFEESGKLYKHIENPDKQALSLIQICKIKNSTTLDLSNLGLVKFPEEIFQLNHISDLNLNYNQIREIPADIKLLTKLKRLRITANSLISLPHEIQSLHQLVRLDLAGNSIKEFGTLFRNLKKLQWLDLNYMHLNTVPREIFSLLNLRLLGLAGTQIKNINGAIGKLKNLELLDLSENSIKFLPKEISGLKNLKHFYLNDNNIQDLPDEIGTLRKLETLLLHENSLSSLPYSINSLKKLKQLTLHENDALDLPAEILGPELGKEADSDKLTNPRDIILFYFARQRESQRPLNEVKVLVVGEGEVGKTSLIRQLRGEAYDPEECKTHGIERHELIMPCGKLGDIQLNIWDFGGQDIMHATHQFFMTHRSVYLLVVDSRQNERQTRIDYWLRLIASYGGDSPVIVVCNKSDQQVMQLNWTALQRDYPQIKAFAKEVCCYHSDSEDRRKGLNELRQEIAKAIENHVPEVNRLLPSTWFNVKNELETDARAYLTLEEYHSAAAARGVTDARDREVLLTLLHQLGTVLHFSEHTIFERDRKNNAAPAHVEELNVLDPGWVTTAIYKLLNDDDLIRAGGIMDRGSMRRSLEQLPNGTSRYPKSKDDFIIAMMRRFEICFAFDGDQETWLLPDLLHEDELDSGDWTGALAFRYEYKVLPASVIGRLMVRLHELIDRSLIWRTGAKFIQGKCEALVRSDPEAPYIEILIRGGLPQERRAMLGLVRGTLNAIHQSFSDKLGENEKIPAPGYPNVFISYQKLLLLEAEGDEYEREVVNDKLIKISVSDALNGVTEKQERDFERTGNSRNRAQVIINGNLYHTTGKDMTSNFSTINIGGNVTNSQIGQSLQNCTNLIHSQPDGEKKALLSEITKETTKIIEALPEEKKPESEQITNNLEQLVKQATSEKPNKQWYSISTEGLIEAANWIKDYSGNIVPTLEKLGKILGFTEN